MSIFWNTVRMQFKLMFNKKTFKLAFSINILYVLLTYLYYVWVQSGQDISTITSPDAVFPLQSSSVFFGMYINIVPFVLVLPFAMSFISDKSNLILPALQSRSGIKNYYFAKGIACFCGTFLVFFIPFLISVGLNSATFPQSGITFLGDLYDMNYDAGIVGSTVLRSTRWVGIYFPELFLFNEQLYNIVILISFSISMGILGVFTYAFSFIFSKNKITLFLPVYLIVVTLNILDSFLENVVPYTCYKVLQYITVNSMYGKNPIFIITFFSIIIIVGIMIILKQSRTDQIDK